MSVFGKSFVKTMKRLLCTSLIVLSLAAASSSSFALRSTSTRFCNTRFSFDCNLSATKLPINSIASPIKSNPNPIASNGKILGWRNFASSAIFRRYFFPKTLLTHFPYLTLLPNFTINSAASSSTPIITSAAPNNANPKKNSEENEEFESMNRAYEKLALVHLITFIGVLLVPILFIAAFLLMPVKAKR